MTYATSALNTHCSDAIAHYTWIGLHTADPGTTGASEATGGSPVYTRVGASWGAPSGGVASAAPVTFNVPAGTYTHYSVWNAATGGTYFAGHALNANQVLTGQGTVQVTATHNQAGS